MQEDNKTLNELRKFKSISKKEIHCMGCGYRGVMGLKFQTFKNPTTIIGIVLMILGFVFAVGAGVFSEGWFVMIFGLVLIFVGVVRTNKFQCPNCFVEIAMPEFTKPNAYWDSK